LCISDIIKSWHAFDLNLCHSRKDRILKIFLYIFPNWLCSQLRALETHQQASTSSPNGGGNDSPANRWTTVADHADSHHSSVGSGGSSVGPVGGIASPASSPATANSVSVVHKEEDTSRDGNYFEYMCVCVCVYIVYIRSVVDRKFKKQTLVKRGPRGMWANKSSSARGIAQVNGFNIKSEYVSCINLHARGQSSISCSWHSVDNLSWKTTLDICSSNIWTIYLKILNISSLKIV